MSALRERLAKRGLDKTKLAKASEGNTMTEDRANVLLQRKTTKAIDKVEHGRPLAALLKRAKTLATDAETTKEVPVEEVETKVKASDVLAKLKAAPASAPEPKLSLKEKLALKREAKPEAKPEPKLSLKEKLALKKQPKQDVDTSSLRQPKLGASVEVNAPSKPLSLKEQLAAKKAKAEAEAKQEENRANAVANALEQIESKPLPEHNSLPDAIPPKLVKAKEPKPNRLAGLLKKAKEKADQTKEVSAGAMPAIKIVKDEEAAPQEVASQTIEEHEVDNRAMVQLNEKQLLAVDRALSGDSFCMVGPAGTGKTTGVRGIIKALRDNGKIEKTTEFKRQGGASLSDRVTRQWSVACVAFTRTAANNLRSSITADPDLSEFYYSCQTIHNLLEYYPSREEVWCEEIGGYKETMRFVPMRDEVNKLDIDVLIIEEGSMVDLMLAEKLMAALPSKCQIIYLGDINQLPPVFGLPILAYALHKLPVIELTHVYRQAIGPVLNAAHNILEGKMPVADSTERGELNLYHEYRTPKGTNSIKSHAKDAGTPISLGQENCANIYAKMFELLFKGGNYDPEEDMILTPWNKRELGTANLNAMIAQFVGDARDAQVHEVIAGFNKHYLAVGDKVMVDKQPGVVTKISYNTDYIGKAPTYAGNSLSRFGHRIMGRDDHDIDLEEVAVDDYQGFDLDKIGEEKLDEIKRAASSVVEVMLDTDTLAVLNTAGDFAPDRFSLGYVLTTHKAQGMEFPRVWLITHREQATTITREWLYTGTTRAKKACTIIGHEEVIKRSLARQRIAGNSLEEKIEAFTGAVDNIMEVDVVPN